MSCCKQVTWEISIGDGVELWQEGARRINECAYLFATDVRETEELTLGLTIVEAKSPKLLAQRQKTPGL